MRESPTRSAMSLSKLGTSTTTSGRRASSWRSSCSRFATTAKLRKDSLDVRSTRAVREIIRALREQGRCILFSSHVMQEVAALCDRVVVIARGRVVADGTPDELRARTGRESLEEAFVQAIGSDAGLSQ